MGGAITNCEDISKSVVAVENQETEPPKRRGPPPQRQGATSPHQKFDEASNRMSGEAITKCNNITESVDAVPKQETVPEPKPHWPSRGGKNSFRERRGARSPVKPQKLAEESEKDLTMLLPNDPATPSDEPASSMNQQNDVPPEDPIHRPESVQEPEVAPPIVAPVSYKVDRVRLNSDSTLTVTMKPVGLIPSTVRNRDPSKYYFGLKLFYKITYMGQQKFRLKLASQADRKKAKGITVDMTRDNSNLDKIELELRKYQTYNKRKVICSGFDPWTKHTEKGGSILCSYLCRPENRSNSKCKPKQKHIGHYHGGSWGAWRLWRKSQSRS